MASRLAELDLAPLFRGQSRLDERLPDDAFGRLDASDDPRGFVAAHVAEVATGETLARRRRRKQKRFDEETLPSPGTVFDDKYRIEALVGAGGFAVVYRATHLVLDAPVAVKLLQPELMRRQPELADMLCSEARMAARVNHPNVVRVHDAARSPQRAYIVMELVDGCSMADLIEARGRLPTALAMQLAIDVAGGLRAALGAGLVHRDVKPSNILLTRGGEAKLADLGLAQMRSTPAQAPMGKLLGTPGYVAPELGEAGTAHDFRGDMYALGVTLYHAISGQLPFPNTDPERCLWQHRTLPIRPLQEVVPDCSVAVSRAVMWLLARLPSLRPASYDALLERLRRSVAA